MDGPNASHITPKALDRWEQRLSDVFEGRPYDMYDAALSDTVSKYPVDIQVESLFQNWTLNFNFLSNFLVCYNKLEGIIFFFNVQRHCLKNIGSLDKNLWRLT